jgi:hypothetical protein
VSEDLENKLRRALRPVDPGVDFTRGVMERVAENQLPRRRRILRFGWPSAVAASLLLLMIGAGVHQWQESRKAAGLAARQQVIEALRVTSDKLDLAYRLVNTPPQPRPDGDSGV